MIWAWAGEKAEVKVGARIWKIAIGMFISISLTCTNAFGAVTWDNIEKFKAFESGEVLKFDTDLELKEFLSDYLLNYRIKDIRSNYTAYKTVNGIHLTIPEIKQYDRDELMEAIISKFGTPTGNTDFEKLVNACNIVTRNIEYNLGMVLYPIDMVLDYQAGVCWHYTKLVQVLLESADIKSEMVACRLAEAPRKSHVILKSKIGNKWVYTDPTLHKTMGAQGINYLSIDEYRLAKEYRLVHYLGNNWTGIKEESGDTKIKKE